VVASVTVTSAPAGGPGEQAVGQANGTIAVTAPKNKTGTMVVTFSYLLNGVIVTGNTLTLAIV
jgi:hypothetical protein